MSIELRGKKKLEEWGGGGSTEIVSRILEIFLQDPLLFRTIKNRRNAPKIVFFFFFFFYLCFSKDCSPKYSR